MTRSSEAVLQALEEVLEDDDNELPARLLARRFCEEASASDLDKMFIEWQAELAESAVTDIVMRHRSGKRTKDRTSGRGSSQVAAFQAAASAAERGDLVPLSTFTMLESRHIGADGTLKPLREFTAKDLVSLGKRYQSTAERHALVAMFYRQLGVMVRNKTVGEAFDEGKLQAEYRRMTGSDMIEAPIEQLTR